MKTDDLQTALFNAHNRVVTYRGHKYRLDCQFRDVIYPHKREEFHCNALDLNPTTPDEARFCIWDLWRSDSDDAGKLMLRFARLGGYINT